MSTFTTKPITQSYDISSQGSLTIGGCELGGFVSASLSINGESVENYARGDGGWATSAPGKRSWKLDVEFLRLKNDVCQAGLRAMFTSDDYMNKCAEIIYSDGTTSGGFSGDAVLVDLSEDQSNGGEAVNCKASFAGYGALTIVSPTSSGSGT